MRTKAIKSIWLFLTIFPIILIIWGYIYPNTFFANQETLRNTINGYGVFAPLAFIILQILQVVLTPLSHYAISIAGGYIFGTFWGTIYNWIGRVIGSLIAFYIGRYFIRFSLQKFITHKTLKKYDNIFNKNIIILFLIYFLPFFPDDEITYMAGTSKLKQKYFYSAMMLGHVGGSFSLAYVGNGAKFSDLTFILITLITLIGFIIVLMTLKNHRLLKTVNTYK